MSEKTPSVEEATIRLVLPFDFESARLSAGVSALLGAAWPGAEVLWREAKPRTSYVDELTPQAGAVLFAVDGERHGGVHLRVDDALAQRWFQGVVLQPERRGPVAIKLVPEVGIELFLTGYGAGALSISVDAKTSTLSELLDVVYRLAQRGRRKGDPSWIRTPHPSEDPERWAKIPDDKKATLELERGQIPDDSETLTKRMGHRGARFTLGELAEALLAPLGALQYVVRDSSFQAYSVARFGSDITFDGTDNHSLRSALAGLAQVEESRHAGSGLESIRTAVLNSKHTVAMSAQGVAHFVADQDGVGFNNERVPRVRDKYFVPFLLTLLQRSALRHITEHVRQLLAAPTRSPEELRDLRVELLEVGASAMPTEASVRSAVQRYFELYQQVLAVHATYERAERSISGIEQVLSAKRSEALLAAQAESLHAANALHGAVSWLEIFIITAYTAEIVHILSEHPDLPHLAMYVVPMLLAGGVTAALLRPWKHSVH